MTRFLAISAAFALTTSFASAQEWMTNFKAATAKAKAENKPLLMDFTGSDWCPPCMRLNKQVFMTPMFKEYARQNLVLLKVDFPRRTPQSDRERQQNAMLQERYGVMGYPTVIILNPQGKALGKVNYTLGGPRTFIRNLEGISSRK